DQAKGFINGVGTVPNPGYTTDPAKIATNFMPEVKNFSFSTITGYSTPAAATLGIKNSIWLSLVPGGWQDGLQTTPGSPTATPGTNADGTGPAPRTNGPGVDPSGNAGGGSVIPGGPGITPGQRPDMGDDNGGCSVASTGSSGSGAGAI